MDKTSPITAASATAPVPGRIGFASWWMLAILLALYVLALIDRGAIALLVVPIQKDLALSDVQMGVILGPAFAISYSLFGLPMGWASDRFSRRLILFVAITIWSLAAAGSGLATSFMILLIARVLVGAGEAALSPIAYRLCANRRRLSAPADDLRLLDIPDGIETWRCSQLCGRRRGERAGRLSGNDALAGARQASSMAAHTDADQRAGPNYGAYIPS